MSLVLCINASFYLHETKKEDVYCINLAKIEVKNGVLVA